MVQLAFAWFAAAAFAVSLTFFLYAYLVLFADPPPAGWLAAARAEHAPSSAHPAVSTAWNVLLFTIFALHHSLFARTGMKRLVREHIPAAIERAVYTLIASALFILVCWLWMPVTGRAWDLDGPFRVVGYAVQAAGIVVTMIGARALDVLDLAGVRQIQRTAVPHAPLATGGVYGLVRHPLYFGWTLLVFGAPDMSYTRLVFAIVSTAYLVIAIPFEERSLIETFGPEYASYREKVRWRIFPGIH